MLELRESHWFGVLRDGVIVSVEVFADRIERALDVHVRHNGDKNAKLKIVLVTRLELTLLKFAHLSLIPCVHESRFYETKQQRECCLQNEASETIDDKYAKRVDIKQFGERKLEQRSTTTRLVQAHMSSDTVSLPSRFDVADLQLEMQRFW